MNELNAIREEINSIDRDMALLFEKRMKAIKKIAKYKKENGLSVRDYQRETEMIEKSKKYISDYNIIPYYTDFLTQTINLSCKYQLKLMEGVKISYCGGEESTSFLVAKKIFPNAKLISCSNCSETYKMTENGGSDSSIIELESNSDGFNDSLIESLFFGNLFINQIIDVVPNNERLIILSKSKNVPYAFIRHESENFIIVFSIENVYGSLAQVLNIISIHEFNIRTIRNRHCNSKNRSNIFFIEAEGNANTQNGKDMLQELSGICEDLKLVGTYYSNNHFEDF